MELPNAALTERQHFGFGKQMHDIVNTENQAAKFHGHLLAAACAQM